MYRDRSTLAPVGLQFVLEVAEGHHRIARRHASSRQRGRSNPTLAHGFRQHRVGDERAAARLRRTISATTRSRSVTRMVSPRSAKRTYSLSLFFRTFIPTALMLNRVASSSYFCQGRSWRLRRMDVPGEKSGMNSTVEKILVLLLTNHLPDNCTRTPNRSV